MRVIGDVLRNVFLAAAILTPTTAFAVPAVTSVAPSSGPRGTAAIITGSGFGSAKGTSTVSLDGLSLTPTSWSDTSIGITVPSFGATGNLVVRVGGVDSNALTFTVTPSPTVTTVAPSTGMPGTAVTITGAHFGVVPGTVKFGTAAAAITGWSDSGITVTVPDGAGNGVSVRAKGVVTNATAFVTTSKLLGSEATAKAASGDYVGNAGARISRPAMSEGDVRRLEVQLAWFHANNQLFALDRFTLSDGNRGMETAVRSSVTTHLPPPWRVVVTMRETGGVQGEMPRYTCNSDRPFSGQPSCTTSQLPAAAGTVLNTTSTEVLVPVLP